MRVRHSFRLRPGAVASAYLEREWDGCRFVWNHLVALSRDLHDLAPTIALAGAEPVTFGYKAQDAELTRLRREVTDPDGRRWLARGSSVAQQQTVRDYAAVRTKALLDRRGGKGSRSAGLPRFKKRGVDLPALNFTRSGFTLKPDPDTGVLRLVLPGRVSIPVVWSRPLPSAPSSVRVSRDSQGHWHASFVVVAPGAVHGPVARAGAVIGVDWGVSRPATTAILDPVTGQVDTTVTGFDFPARGYDRRNQAALARTQRQMARRAKRDARGRLLPDQSSGYRKAKRLAAKARAKARAQRRDDSRKWAAALVREHEVIAVEDFRPAFLAKSSMARKAADNAVAQMKTDLLWAAAKAGCTVYLVNPAYTSMDCSTCGARAKRRLPLDQRTYECAPCGLVLDRDKNAAINVIARAGFNPADTDGIRRGTARADLAA